MYESHKAVMEKHRDYLISKNRYDYAMLWNRLRLHHFGKNPIQAVGVLVQLFLRHPILTWGHFWTSAPKRLIHEAKMRKNKRQTA